MIAWQYHVAKIRSKERKHYDRTQITRKQCENLFRSQNQLYSSLTAHQAFNPTSREASFSPERKFSLERCEASPPKCWRVRACYERKISMTLKLRSPYAYQQLKVEVPSKYIKYAYYRGRTAVYDLRKRLFSYHLGRIRIKSMVWFESPITTNTCNKLRVPVVDLKSRSS